MKRLFKHVTMTMTLLGLVSMASACGKSGITADSPSPSASASKEPVELTMVATAVGQTQAMFESQIGADVHAKFPEVTLKYIEVTKDVTLASLLAANQPIDLSFVTSQAGFTTLLNMDLAYDMSDLIQKNKLDLNRFEPTTIKLMRDLPGGGIYGLPNSLRPFVIFYNQDLFDKFGVPYPKDGMTWDQLYELDKRMTRVDNGVQYYGMTTSIPYLFQYNQLSLPTYDTATNKVLTEGDDYKKMLEDFLRFFKIADQQANTDLVAKGTALWGDKEQKAAMLIYYGDEFLSRPTPAFRWDMVTAPTLPEKSDTGFQLASSYIGVTKTSKHKEKAFEVLQYLTSDEYVLKHSKTDMVPALVSPEAKTVFATENPNYKDKNRKALFPAKAAANPPFDELSTIALKEVTGTAFKEIVNGDKDINTALREAAERAQKLINTKLGK